MRSTPFARAVSYPPVATGSAELGCKNGCNFLARAAGMTRLCSRQDGGCDSDSTHEGSSPSARLLDCARSSSRGERITAADAREREPAEPPPERDLLDAGSRQRD